MERLAFAAWFYPTRAVHFARYALRGAWPHAQAILVGAFGSLAPASSVSSDIVTRAPRKQPSA